MRISQLKNETNTPEAEQKPNIDGLDKRFKSPAFKAAVKTVLDYLDEPQTFASFKKYDRLYNAEICIDWLAMADRINNPVYEAYCYVLYGRHSAGQGRVVLSDGRPLKQTITIKASSREQAFENINKTLYEFIEWR